MPPKFGQIWQNLLSASRKPNKNIISSNCLLMPLMVLPPEPIDRLLANWLCDRLLEPASRLPGPISMLLQTGPSFHIPWMVLTYVIILVLHQLSINTHSLSCKTITCRTDATKIIVNRLKADESYSVSQTVHINQTIIIDKNFFPPQKYAMSCKEWVWASRYVSKHLQVLACIYSEGIA